MSLSSTTTKTPTTIEALEERVEKLERSRFQKLRQEQQQHEEEGITDTDIEIVVDESVRRARYAVEQSDCCYSVSWKWVPELYYTWTLQQRAECLNASSVHQLCKSLLMENRKHSSSGNNNNAAVAGNNNNNKVNNNNNNDVTNPQFVLVVIQYASTLDVKKLTNVVRALRTDVRERIDQTQFEWRIASADDNKRITGYEFNSVTPFGLLRPNDCRIVVSASIQPYNYFWIGGGHVHLKLGIAFKEFCQAFSRPVVVGDISNIRSAHEIEKGILDD